MPINLWQCSLLVFNVDVFILQVFLKVAEETGVDQDDETKRKKLEEGTDSMY